MTRILVISNLSNYENEDFEVKVGDQVYTVVPGGHVNLTNAQNAGDVVDLRVTAVDSDLEPEFQPRRLEIVPVDD